MSAGGMVVANAPCSYGAFEITVGIDPHVPPGEELLDAVSGAGYRGIDLGPLGYLGTAADLPERLRSRDLALAGGYFEVAFSEPESIPDELVRLDQLLDILDASANGGPPARPTLADAGSESRRAYPGRAHGDHRLGWDDAGWAQFADAMARLLERCRARGYEPTFHPHTATYVEAPWEIDRLLSETDASVCLDTGHLLIGGGDPVQAVRDWGARINHVHLKDAQLAVIEKIVADRAPVRAIWERGAFCRLGTGDVALDDVLAQLREHDYQGWLVVEQDILPDPADPTKPVTDQQLNREYLRERGL
ncbi:MAG TPA: TIM barrel protein [Solirubrobacteraceae bacterium]|jgi:inosose dehydratase|nr:TIM barrel protein [Solirubrobacteraceae bacterium]